MKIFVQFLTLNTKGEVDDLLGSDGVFILDGRNNLNTWIKDAHNRIKQLKNVQPEIVGFKIIKSTIPSFIGPVINEWKYQDKIKLLRKGIKFDEDRMFKIPFKDLDFIEMDGSMTKYQVHLKDEKDGSFVPVREYRGTKTITFHKDCVEIR
jgi:hypothetical protein